MSTEETNVLDDDALAVRLVQPNIFKNVVQSISSARRIQGPLRPADDEDTLVMQVLEAEP